MPGSDDTPPPGLAGKRVWVAGHTGMVGSALVRRLARESCQLVVAGRDDLDLRQQRESEAWIATQRPDVVIVAAARVGGIIANRTYPADFLYDNAMIALNVIHAAHAVGVERLLWLGSSCIYPREASQPIREDALLTGPLEPTNEAYAIAKIAGLKLAEAYARQFGDRFFTAMPTNLYGPGDNFHPENSHVIPGLMRRFHAAAAKGAREVTIWGSGSPMREFLHVDDMAAASVFVLNLDVDTYQANTKPTLSHINVGAGRDCTIRELAELLAEVTGFNGQLNFDTSKPDGAPRKLLDVSRLTALGWQASIPLDEGLRQTYAWFLRNADHIRS